MVSTEFLGHVCRFVAATLYVETTKQGIKTSEHECRLGQLEEYALVEYALEEDYTSHTIKFDDTFVLSTKSNYYIRL